MARQQEGVEREAVARGEVGAGGGNAARRSLPVVTYALIAANVLFLLVEPSGGRALSQQKVLSRAASPRTRTARTILTVMSMPAGCRISAIRDLSL